MEIKKSCSGTDSPLEPVGMENREGGKKRARGTLRVLQLIHFVGKRNGTNRASVPSTSFFLRIVARSVDSSSLAGSHCVHPSLYRSRYGGGDNGWRRGVIGGGEERHRGRVA